jgi:hypothetical protein
MRFNLIRKIGIIFLVVLLGTWGGFSVSSAAMTPSAGGLTASPLKGIGGAYQWHTYYGAGASAADEIAYGLAVYNHPTSGAFLYLTGSAPDTWLGDGDTAPLHPFSGGGRFSNDIVVLKLTGNGDYLWHTFYGSGANDYGNGIALGEGDTLYITGSSGNPWQGDNNADPQHPFSEGSVSAIMVLKLTGSGAYRWHTFYGAGGSAHEGLGIAVDTNQILVSGISAASWTGDGNAGPLHPFSGNSTGDGFALKLSDRVYGLFLPLILRDQEKQ